jgi:signal transduction histidine kinase
VLVSLGLVCACAAAILYLNYLHVNVARDLSENVQSTQVAAKLEATCERLVQLLRNPTPAGQAFPRQVGELQDDIQRYLDEASALANWKEEQLLVTKARAGFADYTKLGKAKMAANQKQGLPALSDLLDQKVLDPARNLHHFNAGQVARSDQENQAIVRKLRWGLLAVAIGLPLGGLLLGYAVARRLRESIYQLSVSIRDAAGRLNRELGSVTLEETGDLPDLHQQMQGIIEEIERNVSQLQQREREVLRAEQLAALGQVAAGVAHELRNPLTSVKMLVQTALEEKRAAGLPQEDLEIMEHEIRRMEQCIRVFLDFARPPQSERRETDLIALIKKAVTLVEGRARRQKVIVTVDANKEPLRLILDPEQVHQVVINLLLNSLDALPHGGEIQVRVQAPHDNEPVQVEGENGAAVHPQPAAIVSVADTGPGIAPRIRDRLFEPFVSSKDTGLGLGLSICKRLVEAHGGTIEGGNSRKQGAVFTFTLPWECLADRVTSSRETQAVG